MTDAVNREAGSKRPRKMTREPERNTGSDASPEGDASTEAALPAALTTSTPTQPQTKAARVEALLTREGGASLGDLCEASGWLQHTARAFLTGLRKKGRSIERMKVDGETRYTIAAAPAP